MKLDVWFNFYIKSYSMGNLFTPDPLTLFMLIGRDYVLEIEGNTVRHPSIKALNRQTIQENIEEDEGEVEVVLSWNDNCRIVIQAIIVDYDEEDDNKLSVRLKVSDAKLLKWFEEVG